MTPEVSNQLIAKTTSLVLSPRCTNARVTIDTDDTSSEREEGSSVRVQA